jgi:hypothetical protein
MPLVEGPPAPPVEELNYYLLVLSVLVPPAGWILGCVFCKTRPRNARICAIAGVAGVVAWVAIVLSYVLAPAVEY